VGKVETGKWEMERRKRKAGKIESGKNEKNKK